MDKKQSHSLILLPSSALGKLSAGPMAIMDGMVSDALAIVRSHERALAAKRFRIGGYEFCDPDYRQILIWAKALRLKPDEVVNRLLCTEIKYNSAMHKLEVINGHIVKLAWDFQLLPISVFEWVNGLCIQSIAFKGKSTANIALQLPMLQELYCFCIHLIQLELTNVPNLTVLWCSHNSSFSKLNLSNVPNLITLICGFNKITELDLSKDSKSNKTYMFGQST